MADHHTFAVSEILSGNRVLVTVYVRLDQHVHVTMTLYSELDDIHRLVNSPDDYPEAYVDGRQRSVVNLMGYIHKIFETP